MVSALLKRIYMYLLVCYEYFNQAGLSFTSILKQNLHILKTKLSRYTRAAVELLRRELVAASARGLVLQLRSLFLVRQVGG